MSRFAVTLILGLLILALLIAGGWWLLNQSSINAGPQINEKWLNYEDKTLGLAFSYPAEYEVVPGSPLTLQAKYPTQAQLRGLLPVKIYLQAYPTATSTFTSFTADLKDNLILNLAWAAHKNDVDDINTKISQGTVAKDEGARQLVALEQDINEEVLGYKDRYSFKDENINGLNALTHTRDVYTGNSKLLETYFDWGGKALIFTSEADNTLLDRLYHSVKKI
jgi:hypothetical protein